MKNINDKIIYNKIQYMKERDSLIKIQLKLNKN